MPFDPKQWASKPVEQKTEGGFDPKKWAAMPLDAPKPEKESSLGDAALTALESFGNAASLGYLPQLQAATGQFIDKYFDPSMKTDHMLKQQGMKLPEKQTYVEMRDEFAKEAQDRSKEHPNAALAGAVGGIVSGGALTGGVGGLAVKGLAGANKAAKLKALLDASKAARVAQAGAAGAGLGAIANPGDVEGEVGLQLGDRIDNAKTGALVGGALHSVFEGAPLVKKFGTRLKDEAEKRAFKALGPYARDTINNYERGRIQEIGRELLDKGVVTGRPAEYEELAKRAAAEKELAGKEIGGIIDKLSDVEAGYSGAKPSAGTLSVPGQKMASAGIQRDMIGKELRDELVSNSGIPGIGKENEFFENLIKEFESGGPIPLKEAQAMKVALGKRINWKRMPGQDIPKDEQFQRALYFKLNKGVDDAAEGLAKLSGDETLSALQKAKKTYGAMDEAEKIATRRESKEMANRILSPTDYLTGGLGAAAGFASGDDIEAKLKNAAVGASLGLVNKYARSRGNQLSSKMRDVSGNQAERLASLLESIRSNRAGVIQGTGAIAKQKMLGEPAFQGFSPNPKVLEMLTNKPELIDSIGDERLREAYRKKVSEQQTRGPAQEQYVPELEAKRRFMNEGRE